MNKRIFISGVLVCLLLAGTVAAQRARRPPPQQKGTVCGDPTLTCKTGLATFQPHDLPFRISARAVIWESETFYAVILKSIKAAEDDCQTFVPEDERQAAQALFPRYKVFHGSRLRRTCGGLLHGHATRRALHGRLRRTDARGSQRDAGAGQSHRQIRGREFAPHEHRL